MSFDPRISGLGSGPLVSMPRGKHQLTITGLDAKPAFRNINAAIPHAKAPMITGAYREILRPEPISFKHEKGFTNHYMDLVKGSSWSELIAKNNIRYARFMKQYTGDHKSFSELPEASLIRMKKGKLNVRTYGEQAITPSKEIQKIAKSVNKQMKRLGLKCNANGYYSSAKTGTVLRVILEPTTKEVCICFYGLRMGDSETRAKIGNRNVLAAIKEFFGGIPLAATQAAQIGALVKSIAQDEGYTPVMIGHSHGGGLAQAAAVANGIKGIVFNSRPMGAGVRRHFRKEVRAHADKITAFTGKGDWLGGTSTFNGIARFLEKIGISAPRTIGYGYNLPKAPGRERKSGFEKLNYQHNKFLKQLREIAGEAD